MFQFACVLAYLVFVLGMGFFKNKQRKDERTAKNYFIAGGSLGFLGLIPLLFGELVGGSMIVGTASTAMTDGIYGAYGLVGSCCGCIFVSLFLSKWLAMSSRYSGVMSGPGACAERFGTLARYVTAVVQLITSAIMFALQIKAASVLIGPMLNVSPDIVAWFVSALFLLMAFLGLKGISDMNLLHGAVLFFGISIVAVACVVHAGGLGEVISALPASHFDFVKPGVATMLASILGTTLSLAFAGGPVNLSFASKDLRATRRALWIGGMGALVFAIFPIMIGFSGYTLFSPDQANSIVYTLTDSFSPVLSVLAVLGVIAAIFSSGPFVLLLFMTVVTRDFLTPLFKYDEGQQVRVSQISGVVVAIVGVFLCNAMGDILNSMLGAMQIQACITVGVLFGLHWKRATNNGCIAGILAGGVVSALWFFAGSPFGVSPLWPGIVLEVIVLVFWSLLESHQPVSEDYAAYLKWKAVAEKTVPEVN